jgi:hypothetical protein
MVEQHARFRGSETFLVDGCAHVVEDVDVAPDEEGVPCHELLYAGMITVGRPEERGRRFVDVVPVDVVDDEIADRLAGRRFEAETLVRLQFLGR